MRFKTLIHTIPGAQKVELNVQTCEGMYTICGTMDSIATLIDEAVTAAFVENIGTAERDNTLKVWLTDEEIIDESDDVVMAQPIDELYCNSCKHAEKNGDEPPCSACKHNYPDQYNRRVNDEKA